MAPGGVTQTSPCLWRQEPHFHMPVVLVLRSLRQEDLKFKANLGSTERPCLKTLKKPNNPKNKQIFKTCFSNYVWVFGQTRPTCMCMINNLNLDNTCGHFTSWSENYHFIKIHLKLVRSRQRYYLRLNNELWNTVSFLKTCYPFCKLNYLAILTF